MHAVPLSWCNHMLADADSRLSQAVGGFQGAQHRCAWEGILDGSCKCRRDEVHMCATSFWGVLLHLRPFLTITWRPGPRVGACQNLSFSLPGLHSQVMID